MKWLRVRFPSEIFSQAEDHFGTIHQVESSGFASLDIWCKGKEKLKTPSSISS
jgi:hypothetical protein